jgi:uncharacterized protein
MSHRHFPFVVLEIEAENLQRAGAFYSTIFGWSFTESDVELGALEAELGGDHDTMVRVHLRTRDPLAPGLTLVGRAARGPDHSLCVHDLTPILAGVVAAGGQLISGPVDVPGLGRRLYVRDTEGNEVAIVEPAHEGDLAPIAFRA